MLSKLLGRTTPVTQAPSSDTLILKDSVKLSGFRLIFTSKLTTAPSGYASHSFKSVLFGDPRARAAKAVKGMISELKLGNSRHDDVRTMAGMTLTHIKTNKAASRAEVDRLFLLASLMPQERNEEDLVCAPSPVESYARRRAEVCLAQTLGLAPAVRDRYTKTLLDYAADKTTILDKARQGSENPDVLMLHLTLKGLVKSLEATVPKLPESDVFKAALATLLDRLKQDIGSLAPLPPGRQ